jgi:3-oxoacyl-[acyl-carrier protein] reductase
VSDFLIELGQSPRARKWFKKLNLPIPLPQKLDRAEGPAEERPLHNRDVVIGFGRGASLAEPLALALTAAGANPLLVDGDAYRDAFAEPGEAHARPATLLNGEAPEDIEPYALIFDATGLDDTASLRQLYDFFHPWAANIARCGRLIVLGRPLSVQSNIASAAAQFALSGFVRSIAKEVGRKGATAQLLTVDPGAEDRLAGVLRFLLSPHSAFVSGQCLDVSAIAKAPKHTPWLRPLDGKIALVTGAARGIGKATAERLASEGAHVVCLDRPADDGPCSQVAREVGGSVLLADVSDPAAASIIADGLRERGVDIVVHNAGVTRDKTIARMKPESWDQAIGINLTAVADITQALLDEDILRDDGRLICLSSIAGIAGNMGQTNYAASKAGIIGLVRHLAAEVADRGITVNAIAPGFIETRLTKAVPAVTREAGRRMCNLGQGGLPRDVAAAISFLATPGAYGITGSVLRVCGGSLIGA